MRFIPIKNIEQQDIQNIHRERLKKERTELMNQIPGLLAQYGTVINRGVVPVRRDLSLILKDTENELGTRLSIRFPFLITEH